MTEPRAPMDRVPRGLSGSTTEAAALRREGPSDAGHTPRYEYTGLVSPWHVEPSQTRDQTHVLCIGRQILNPVPPGKSSVHTDILVCQNYGSWHPPKVGLFIHFLHFPLAGPWNRVPGPMIEWKGN